MKILCVGAGGSGMAAIVRWHVALRDVVFVTDDIVPAEKLVAQYPGAEAWTMGEGVPDRIVFSDAIPAAHPLRAYAKRHDIRETSFPEELGVLCEGRHVVAVTGTHGKSTTTALLAWALAAAGKDPLCVIGAEIAAWNGNFRWGTGLVVVEADEYRKHLLALHPEVVVITSLEMDHFDTYADEPSLLRTFVEFCSQPSVRRVFIGRGMPMLEDLARELSELNSDNFAVFRFGTKGDFVSIDDVRYEAGMRAASLTVDGVSEAFAVSAAACSHVSNLAAVVSVLAAENIPFKTMKDGIASFPGIRRRLEYVGTLGGAKIYSDYAHHPTAVRETLAACRKIWPDARIAALFEPHERLRTSRLEKEYAGAFKPADAAGILPVYDPVGRERTDIEDVTRRIAEENALTWLADYDAGFGWMQKFAKDSADKEAIIIVMGAGPIDGQIRKRMQAGA